jgi:hypothetical protein
MTSQINISESLDDKLKSIAEPFVDTRETVLNRVVDFYISNHGAAPRKAEGGESSAMAFPADAPPDLTFTRPLAIKLDGAIFEKKDLYWNALMFDVVGRAAAKLKSLEKLKQLLLVNYVDGQGSQQQGYRFIPAAGLSVQGQDSNAAWKATMHLIKATGMNIDVTFMWENKDKAAHPGKTGRMVLGS